MDSVIPDFLTSKWGMGLIPGQWDGNGSDELPTFSSTFSPFHDLPSTSQC